MDAAFWVTRWAEGRIGFHEGRPNAFLDRYVERLGVQRQVLVPLCGKAEDLAYLAGRGHGVVGVELVEDAVRAFFDEHEVTPRVSPHGPFTAYTAGAITILAGDVFSINAELVGPVDALYDRAALIALPPDSRRRYATLVRSVMTRGGTGLVITLEYPAGQLDGPPFSVGEDEVRALYPGHAIEQLDHAPSPTPPLRDPSLTAIERCYALDFGAHR